MAEPHVLSVLCSKYDELLGLLRCAEGDARQLRADLAHVEATIRLFRPGWDSATAHARRPRKSSRWAKPGEGTRLFLRVLREADTPLTAREVAERALRLADYPTPDSTTLIAVAGPITALFMRRADYVERLAGRPARWRFKPIVAHLAHCQVSEGCI